MTSESLFGRRGLDEMTVESHARGNAAPAVITRTMCRRFGLDRMFENLNK
jgi:hypothetical protein